MAFHDPAFPKALAVWHYAAPGIATLLASSLVLSGWGCLVTASMTIRPPGQAPRLARVADRPCTVGRGR